MKNKDERKGDFLNFYRLLKNPVLRPVKKVPDARLRP